MIIENGKTITATNDLRVTSNNGGTLYINNDKTNGGHLRFNTSSPNGSNVYIDHGDLICNKEISCRDLKLPFYTIGYRTLNGNTNGLFIYDETIKAFDGVQNLAAKRVYIGYKNHTEITTGLKTDLYVWGDLQLPYYRFTNRNLNGNANGLYIYDESVTGIVAKTVFIGYNEWEVQAPGVLTNLKVSGIVFSKGVELVSDYRLKSNVRDIEEFTTLNLRPVQYDMSDKHRIGLIAHELQEQFPFLVTGEKDGKEMQSVNYIDLIPVLIKDIQRLSKKNADLEERILRLESLLLDNSRTR